MIREKGRPMSRESDGSPLGNLGWHNEPEEEEPRETIWGLTKDLCRTACEDLDVTPSDVARFGVAAFAALLSLGLVYTLVICLVYAVPVWLCWNLAAVPVLGAWPASYLQAYGLTLLCRLLIKSGNANMNVTVPGKK